LGLLRLPRAGSARGKTRRRTEEEDSAPEKKVEKMGKNVCIKRVKKRYKRMDRGKIFIRIAR